VGLLDTFGFFVPTTAKRDLFCPGETPRRRSLLTWLEIGKAFPAGAKATDGRIFRHRALVGGPVWMWKQQGRHSLQLPEPERVVFLGTALFLGPFLVRRETEKAFLAAAKPKDGLVRVVCLRTAKHWGSSANYKLRCAPVRAAGQGSGGFRKVSRSSSADGR
jgi:hypothetical protein